LSQLPDRRFKIQREKTAGAMRSSRPVRSTSNL
jgi:hypothetical protein